MLDKQDQRGKGCQHQEQSNRSSKLRPFKLYRGRRKRSGSSDAVDKCCHKHAQNELGDAIAQEDAQQARAVLGRYGRKRQGEQREDHSSSCQSGGGNGNQGTTQFRDATSGANQKLTFRRSQVKRTVTLLFARVLIRHLCLASRLTQSIHLDPGPTIVHLIPTTRYTSPLRYWPPTR